MRHHRRADDPDRDVKLGGAALQTGDEPSQRLVHGGPDPQRLIQKAREDDPKQRADRELELAKAQRLEPEDPKRDHACHQPGHEQRHPEQQVQPDRGAEELRDVGRHRHDLGLHPHPEGERAVVFGSHDLGIVEVGDNPELGRQVLDHHRDEVRRQHDPQQDVAELRAALHVGGEVPRVDVRDRGDERGTEHEQRRPDLPPLEEALERALLELLI